MLYAIGDTHLSQFSDKPMDVFGGKWNGYTDKLRSGFSALSDDDVTVICGDVSWGMTLEESLEDFRLLDRFPGKKLIVKGNHDYWWSSLKKMTEFFEANGIRTIEFLHNNCYRYGDRALCGTRGWFYEEGSGSGHDRKILSREVQRLETSLKAAGDAPEKICFLHYPPRYGSYVCSEIIDVMERYGVKECCYGHIHGDGQRMAVRGTVDGILYRMVSADYLNFSPLRLE